MFSSCVNYHYCCADKADSCTVPVLCTVSINVSPLFSGPVPELGEDEEIYDDTVGLAEDLK